MSTNTTLILYRFVTAVAVCIFGLVVPSILYAHKLPPMPSNYGSDRQLTSALQKTLQNAVRQKHAKQGTGLLIDANSGQIMAASTIIPPQNKQQVTDMITQTAWEPGSVMKPLLLAAAINEKTIDPSSTIFQNNPLFIDGYQVTNANTFDGSAFSVQDIITYSINIGAVKTLESLSPHDTIDSTARTTWYTYLTQHYHFGQPTGVNTNYENKGYVAPPNVGPDLDVRYTNMAIGQGLTVSPLQLALAYAALINGGTYYQPHIGTVERAPIVLRKNVVSLQTSTIMRHILAKAYAIDWPGGLHNELTIGGKSGTAHTSDPAGFYKSSADNGTYIGYIANGRRTFILLVRLDEPRTTTFASHEAAAAWVDFVNHNTQRFIDYPQ